jgi:hypothetical protein
MPRCVNIFDQRDTHNAADLHAHMLTPSAHSGTHVFDLIRVELSG